MKTPHSLAVSCAVCLLLMPAAHAEEASYPVSNDPDVQAWAARKARADAEKEALQAEAALENERNAAEAAARQKRETELTTAINTVAQAKDKFPQGTRTTNNDFVATPATTALGIRALESAACAVACQLRLLLTQKTVIFTASPPSPSDTLEFQYFQSVAARLIAEFDQFRTEARAQNVPEPDRQSKMLTLPVAAAALAALPDLIQVFAGLMRSDITERVGSLGVTESSFATLVAKELNGESFVSLDAYAYSRLTTLSALKSVTLTEDLLKREEALNAAIAERDERVRPMQRELADNGKQLEALEKQRVANQTARHDVILQTATEDGGAARPLLPLDAERAEIDRQIGELRAEIQLFQRVLDAQLTEKAKLMALRDKMAALSRAVLRDASGVPHLVNLIRQELVFDSTAAGDDCTTLAARAKASPLRFVTLKVEHQPQSTIEKKSLWMRSYYAASLVHVSFTVTTAAGEVERTGNWWQSFAEKLPKPSDLPRANLNARKAERADANTQPKRAD